MVLLKEGWLASFPTRSQNFISGGAMMYLKKKIFMLKRGGKLGTTFTRRNLPSYLSVCLSWP